MSTSDPEHSQTQCPAHHLPRCAEHKPEPNVDGEPEPKPVTTDKPSPRSATELRITTEPEPLWSSDQVQEPATMPATKEKAVDSESTERSSAPCTVAEGDLIMDLELCNS